MGIIMKKIPKRYWDDDRWAMEHYDNLMSKYPQKWVAIVNGKVVAVADGPKDAREKARKKTGKKYIPVTFVESGLNLY